MDEQIPNKDSTQGFVRKSIDTPILDSDLRSKFGNSAQASNSDQSGFKGFYQANKIYFWAILAGALIIGVLAYFAFKKSPAPAPTDANVAVKVEVPQTVASGGEAVYKITLQNNDSQKLVNLELEAAYPQGIAYESSSPNAENLSGTLFKVPDLISGQNAVVFLKTKVSGNVNDQLTLNLKLHYHYSNFTSEFIKEQASAVRLVASDVMVELDGPANTNNAQLVVYTIKYQNNSAADIQNARIKMDYPDGFSFSSATPPPDLGSDTFNVDKLAVGASGSIQIQGTFNAQVNPGETKTATAEFLILGQDGQYFIQNSSQFTTGISSLPLLVTQALSPDNSNGVINPGDNLNFNVTYQNNGSTAATGVVIEVDLNSKIIDLSSIRAEGGQISNSSIFWNAASVPQLASLQPNQSGQLRFSVKVNNPAVKDSSKNLTLVSNIQIKSNEYTTPFPGGALNLKVSSPSSINTNLSFVSGQLPPQVGRSTVYKVKISLTNSSNDFSNGIVTASIPLASGGFVSSSVSPSEANNVQFDPSTSKITWNVGSLPANTGRFSQARSLEFQITLNPSSSQARNSVNLVTGINFSAKDLFTTQPVSINADNISTSDVQGTNGYGNGQVTP